MRLLVCAVTRLPGVMMPARLSGSAALTEIKLSSALLVFSRLIERNIPTASGNANCSPEMPVINPKKNAPRYGDSFTFQESLENNPVTLQEDAPDLFCDLRIEVGVDEHSPGGVFSRHHPRLNRSIVWDGPATSARHVIH